MEATIDDSLTGREGIHAGRAELRRALDRLLKPHPGDRPGLVSRAVAVGEGPTHPKGRVFLYRDVLEELTKACRYREAAAMALLWGDYGFDARGLYVEVEGYTGMEYLGQRSLLEGVGEAVEDWWKRDDAAQGLVGYVAMVPGSQAMLGREMARAHLSYFNGPQQVAVVIDGPGDRIGFYRRGGEGAFVNQGFFVVEEGSQLMAR